MAIADKFIGKIWTLDPLARVSPISWEDFLVRVKEKRDTLKEKASNALTQEQKEEIILSENILSILSSLMMASVYQSRQIEFLEETNKELQKEIHERALENAKEVASFKDKINHFSNTIASLSKDYEDERDNFDEYRKLLDQKIEEIKKAYQDINEEHYRLHDKIDNLKVKENV